jgi:UDPglucose 6-dehydrogenase
MSFLSNVKDGVKEAQVIFIAVGTPELPDGSADMAPTYNALKDICEVVEENKFVVLKSTVPIGSAKKVQAFCDEHCQHKIEVINNPEFLRQGAAVDDFLKPDRVVVGCQSKQAAAVMEELYKPFVNNARNETQFLVMDNTSAEMTKYAANSFLAIKISFINELALLADKLGANINSVRDGFTSDWRIHPAFFQPGIGYGGSCFPKDVRALRHTGDEVGIELKLLKATDEVNERQKTIISTRLSERFGDLKGMRIALWGLAFKPRTDDVRRAPSLKLIEDLVGKGATVVAFDPVATNNAKRSCVVEFETAESAIEAAKDADVLVLVTEWNEFKSTNLNELKTSLKNPIVFDGRNVFEPATMKEAGFEYYNIGSQVLV